MGSNHGTATPIVQYAISDGAIRRPSPSAGVERVEEMPKAHNPGMVGAVDGDEPGKACSEQAAGFGPSAHRGIGLGQPALQTGHDEVFVAERSCGGLDGQFQVDHRVAVEARGRTDAGQSFTNGDGMVSASTERPLHHGEGPFEQSAGLRYFAAGEGPIGLEHGQSGQGRTFLAEQSRQRLAGGRERGIRFFVVAGHERHHAERHPGAGDDGVVGGHGLRQYGDGTHGEVPRPLLVTTLQAEQRPGLADRSRGRMVLAERRRREPGGTVEVGAGGIVGPVNHGEPPPSQGHGGQRRVPRSRGGSKACLGLVDQRPCPAEVAAAQRSLDGRSPRSKDDRTVGTEGLSPIVVLLAEQLVDVVVLLEIQTHAEHGREDVDSGRMSRHEQFGVEPVHQRMAEAIGFAKAPLPRQRVSDEPFGDGHEQGPFRAGLPPQLDGAARQRLGGIVAALGQPNAGHHLEQVGPVLRVLGTDTFEDGAGTQTCRLGLGHPSQAQVGSGHDGQRDGHVAVIGTERRFDGRLSGPGMRRPVDEGAALVQHPGQFQPCRRRDPVTVAVRRPGRRVGLLGHPDGFAVATGMHELGGGRGPSGVGAADEDRADEDRDDETVRRAHGAIDHPRYPHMLLHTVHTPTLAENRWPCQCLAGRHGPWYPCRTMNVPTSRTPRTPPPLPVDDVMPAVVAALRAGSNLVVVAPPGAGKTTRIPPALVAAGLVPKTMVMLQPRRVAARAAARRMADEQGWQLGSAVGYQVRFERRLDTNTTVQVLTEGVLGRRLQRDPYLDDVSVVMLDEFHLRSLDGDVLLGVVRMLQQTVRPDLRVLVTSATMDPAPVAAFLGGCPVVTCTGRSFPVSVEYERVDGYGRGGRGRAPTLEVRAAHAVRRAWRETSGHVLVFLPGAAEIRRVAGALADMGFGDDVVLPLHGSLPAEAQDRAVRPPVERAVVLATNVAETSLTIDGVTAVVDGGLVRLVTTDPARGLSRLETRRIGLDSAEQRAGRAGRTGPGRVYRLWTEAEQRGLVPTTAPEVARVDLTATVLELRALGEDPAKFPWFEPPPPRALATADDLLLRLGAVDGTGQVSDRGRAALALPLHPRLGVMLARYPTADVALVAAILGEGEIVTRFGEASATRAEGAGSWGPGQGFHDDAPTGPSDLLYRLDLFHQAQAVDFRRDVCRQLGLDGGALRQVARVRDDLLHQLGNGATDRAPDSTAGDGDIVLRALLAAFPDRVARRRAPASDRASMVGGRGLVLARSSVVRRAEYFVAVDVDGVGNDALVRLASEVAPAWLPTRDEDHLRFDDATERVVAVTRTMYDTLCLRERPARPCPDEAAALLAEHAARDLRRALQPSDEVERLRARIACLGAWMPELDLPEVDDEALAGHLPTWCTTVPSWSFAALRRLDLVALLTGLLTWSQRRALDDEAPERLTVPSGAAIRLQYEPGRPPVLAVQLQHLFGLADGPRVAGGRVAVLLHLLAPNGRPAQVTDDLRSFWNETYPQVRKELRGRYPKHAWPEDPWSAKSERK